MRIPIEPARSRWLSRVLNSPVTPILLMVIGIVLRLLWLRYGTGPNIITGEATNAVRAFTATGTIADAFRPGQGPTAHLMPVPLLIAGGVYRLLGYQTIAAESILAAWSLFLVFTSFFFLDRTFKLLDSPQSARVIALVLLCILPLNFSLEIVAFRVLDGGLAVALASIFLYMLVKWDGQYTSRVRVTAASFFLASLFFISPNFGVAGVLCCAVFIYRNIPLRRWLECFLVLAVAVVIVFGPWTLRNERVMGSPIVLRDNLGLEMALAFHPGALDSANPRQTFFLRHKQIHPLGSGNGYAALQRAGGEIAYSKQLSAQTWTWIRSNPGAAAKLAVRHLVEALYPPAWYWNQFSERGTATVPKLIVVWFITSFGLAGIVYSLIKLKRGYGYASIMTLVPLLPLALVQPTLRYRYLVFALLAFFAADFGARILRRISLNDVSHQE